MAHGAAESHPRMGCPLLRDRSYFTHDTPVSDRSKDLFFSLRQDRWRACTSSKHCSSGSRPTGGGTRLCSLRYGAYWIWWWFIQLLSYFQVYTFMIKI